MNILLCTLGQSWAVIPEVFALLNPRQCPLYLNHPQAEAIEHLRQAHDLQPVDELWVCTTNDDSLTQGVQCLQDWRTRVAPEMPLRIWRTAEVADVGSQDAGNQVRELIYRAVLLATEHTGAAGKLYLSLAGGRKTMSADLQRAGMVMGCQGLLHVIAPPFGQMSQAMQFPSPGLLAGAPKAADIQGVVPLVVGQGQRSELLDIEDGPGRVSSRLFPLPLAEQDGSPWAWSLADPACLPEEISRREREGSRLLGNFIQLLSREERHENWRALYRLPPAIIEQLRQTAVRPCHADWLQQLPKADLHRHIGGCLHLPQQRKVGQAIWASLSPAEKKAALARVRPLLTSAGQWPWDWPQQLKQGPRAHHVAALLVHASDEQLQHHLFRVTEPRIGLEHHHPHGFAAYERPGELTGSAVLSHPEALQTYLECLLDNARQEGLSYLELRGSPHKYFPGQPDKQMAFLRQLQHFAQSADGIALRFIIIADRRQLEHLHEPVNLAVRAHEALDGFVVGMDLAGDENKDTPETLARIAEAFLPVFEACLPVTIHAGEGTPPENIWAAAYQLHADRVGHGLTLLDKPELLQRFRDRGICVELCPTSNHEVVGYCDSPYPLQAYWQQGVPLALCTDNPGISRTDATGELLKAAEFWPEIKLWDLLAMIKQGFVHAFAPAALREQLMKAADQYIFEQVWAAARKGLLESGANRPNPHPRP